jgi:hypothetical protein
VIEKSEPTSFEDAIRTCVAPIDDYLGELRVPIPDRVLRAALLFLEHNVQEIRGDSKDDFIEKIWFRFIYQTIHSWYQQKYGAALKRPAASLTGACEVSGSFFEICVPVILVRPEKPGQTIWLIFPIDLQPEENPASWFVAPPNFDAFESSARNTLLRSAITTAHLLRSIHCDLMTTNYPDQFATALAAKIQSHLSTSAAHLTHPRNPMFGLSVWESHQAVESALKLLTQQITGKYQKLHDLIALCRDVPGQVLSTTTETLVKKMPGHRRIIQIRAGESRPVRAADAYKFYRTSLDLTAEIIAVMPRAVRMQNAQFLLKKAPFI